MNEIKEYKQKTLVQLKDGRYLTTEKTPREIFEWIKDSKNSHIFIEWEMHSKFDVVNAVPISMDDMESLIQSQPKEIQNKIRQKQEWLKSEMGKEMTLDYLKSYLSKLTE